MFAEAGRGTHVHLGTVALRLSGRPQTNIRICPATSPGLHCLKLQFLPPLPIYHMCHQAYLEVPHTKSIFSHKSLPYYLGSLSVCTKEGLRPWTQSWPPLTDKVLRQDSLTFLILDPILFSVPSGSSSIDFSNPFSRKEEQDSVSCVTEDRSKAQKLILEKGESGLLSPSCRT